MKKQYIKPCITVINIDAETLMAASGPTPTSNNSATYGNENENGQTDAINTIGDGDGFIMESKQHGSSIWDD